MDGLDALKISEEKKKYIVDLLNPVLEEMVAECIYKMPEDPVPFMLEWLENKKVEQEDKQLSPERRDQLEKENKMLQENVNKVKSQMQEAAKLAAQGGAQQEDEEEEEEDDDDDGEPPPGFGEERKAGPRQSVSAEAYGEWNTKKNFVPPVISKTDEQKDRLKSCLRKSFLFMSLEENDLGICIGAMKEVNVTPEQKVITQGENGDFLFVIESGTLDCSIKLSDGTDKVVKTCTSGDVFGELALLYNCPRAASVIAKEKGTLWQLDRDTFNHIVKEAAQKKRQRYDTFLSKVPLLAQLDAYERGQIADALKSETFSDGQKIIVQGEKDANKFYIIEEGEAVATKNDSEVMRYTAGDYFGELALIRGQERAATVTCKGSVKIVSVDRQSFKRLLNVQDLLERSTKYT